MHPDLYTDIHTTLESLQKYLDDNPLETQEDIQAFSFGFQAAMYLSWFLEACSNRRNSDEGQV